MHSRMLHHGCCISSFYRVVDQRTALRWLRYRDQKVNRTRASFIKNQNRAAKTYNSGDSPVVTHLITSPPVSCLSTAERTGSAEFRILWSYVEDIWFWSNICVIYPSQKEFRVRLRTMVVTPPFKGCDVYSIIPITTLSQEGNSIRLHSKQSL
jgi:hypothetical protein